MRTHIEDDIYITSSSGGLGFTIDKRTMVNVKDKETGEVVGEKETFVTVEGGNHTSLSGAFIKLLHNKIVSIPHEPILELHELTAIIKDYKSFIESKFGV
ncbi:hypothetical protein PAECIP111891_04228 [Paenibacillus allorhizoplanae]|uniref:Uncharacterized protein n=1 Tax=Paenibacillus allorhizoplanae TaxID=2905648 RepID=A0ABM9CKN6_9BACL|nr:hypothetical protein [Paenibacillus allorhizoplanae]CAH1215200.1 hypothetical protein PAECIP111891_04228 [Paenibacillus allorhizoplanae]